MRIPVSHPPQTCAAEDAEAITMQPVPKTIFKHLWLMPSKAPEGIAWQISAQPAESGLPVTAVAILPEGTKQKGRSERNQAPHASRRTPFPPRLPLQMASPHLLPATRATT